MKKRLTILVLVLLLANTPVAFADFVPNDSFYHNQWYFSRIDAEKAWEKTNSSPNIVIAVIDSGIDIKHEDLKGNIWTNNQEIPGNNYDDDRNGFVDDTNGWDFIDNEPNPSPQFANGWTESGVSHGTIIAGIISARGDNNQGIAGITWQSKIMPLKVLNDRGEGRLSSVVRAVDYAVNNGADIINLSFTGSTYSESLREALERAYNKGVVVVAAAGNEQNGGGDINTDKKPIYPACYKGRNGEDLVVGVAATDALDQKTSFSGYGSKCVDLTAPGISFFSTITKGGNEKEKNKKYDGYWSGTSMASAVVSGVLALTMQTNPELSGHEALDIVLGTCDNITQLNPAYKNQLGYGRVNANRAVSFAQELLYEYSNLVVAAPASAVAGQEQQKVKVFSVSGDLVKEFDPFPGYRGGIKVANGEFDGKEGQDLVFSANGNQLKIFSFDGKLKKQFYPFAKNYKGAISLAAADFNSDGLDEIIAAPSEQALPLKIFGADGKLKKEIYPYGKKYKGGINVSAVDFNSDGKIEIIVSSASAQEKVKIFSETGSLLKSFNPFDFSYKGGINIAPVFIFDQTNQKSSKLAFVPTGNIESVVRIYNGNFSLQRQFLAFDHTQKKGANLSSADFDNDGLSDLAAASTNGISSQIRLFSNAGKEINAFSPYGESFKGGVNLGVIKIKN